MLSPTVTCCGDNFLSKTGGYLGSAEVVRKTRDLRHVMSKPRRGEQHAKTTPAMDSSRDNNSSIKRDRVEAKGRTSEHAMNWAPPSGTDLAV